MPGTPTTALPPSTTTTSTGGPSPTQDGLISTCSRFYQAVAGDTCNKIAATYGTFSTADFVTWNPAVGESCSGLLVGYYYCVGTPSTPTITTTPTGPAPTQTGIISTCNSFYRAVSGDTCDKIVARYGTFTLSQFLGWNPAVGSDCSGLVATYYYCVGVPGLGGSSTTTTATSTSTSTRTSTTASGPTPTQTGIISACTRYHKAVDGDSCTGIVQQYGTFTLDQFLAWNSAVGADCAGLWLGYYYCIGKMAFSRLASRAIP